MKALILVKHLYLRHVLVKLPYLVPTFLLHKELHATVIQFSIVINLLNLPLFLIVNYRGCLRII